MPPPALERRGGAPPPASQTNQPRPRRRAPRRSPHQHQTCTADSWSVVSLGEISRSDSSSWGVLSSLNPDAEPFTPFASVDPSLYSQSATQSVVGDDSLSEAKEACTVCCDWIGPDESAVAMQRCAHVFHSRCLRSWFATGNSSCPNCRAPSERIVKMLPLRERVLASLEGGNQVGLHSTVRLRMPRRSSKHVPLRSELVRFHCRG